MIDSSGSLMENRSPNNNSNAEINEVYDGYINNYPTHRSTFCSRLPSRSTILAWISMCLAVLSGSGIGPMFHYMETNGVTPALAACWRCQTMCIFLIPLALIEVWYQNFETKVKWFEVVEGLQYPVWVHILIAGLAWSANLLFWITGLKYTSTVHGALFAGMHPIMYCCYIRFKGTKVSSLEWIGVFTSFSGIAIAGFDGIRDIFLNSKSEETDTRAVLFGDFLCLCASMAEVLVIVNRTKTKPHVPLLQYTAFTSSIVVVMSALAAIAWEDSAGRVLCLQEHCIVGWASKKWLYTMLLFGLIIGVVCITGFNYALQYIPPLVFAAITLIDPIITGIISWLTGLEGIPDKNTWIGGFVVIAGVGLITFGEHHRSLESNSKYSDREIKSNSRGNYEMVELSEHNVVESPLRDDLSNIESGSDDISSIPIISEYGNIDDEVGESRIKITNGSFKNEQLNSRHSFNSNMLASKNTIKSVDNREERHNLGFIQNSSISNSWSKTIDNSDDSNKISTAEVNDNRIVNISRVNSINNHLCIDNFVKMKINGEQEQKDDLCIDNYRNDMKLNSITIE